MSTRRGVLAGGNWIVDKLKTIDRYPQQDALCSILEESVGNGGSPFNVLVDLARMQASFPLAGVGLIGDDAEGRWVRTVCARHGIGSSHLAVCHEASTSYTDVMTVRSSGRRTFFHQRGANAFLDEDHFGFADGNTKIFHLGYLLLLDRLDQPDGEGCTAAARVLERAVSAGCKTSVDVVSEDSDRFASVVLPALRWVDYCFLNEFEAERTTGIATRRGETIEKAGLVEAARRLLSAGVREWVIIHHPGGACALGHDGRPRWQGSVQLVQEDIVGMTGAGDAFAAGVLYGLHEDESIETALRYGVCAAAACLGSIGCSDGVRPLAQCLELGRARGFHG